MSPNPNSNSIDRRPWSLASALAVCCGGWLVPGLAHFLLGRWIRGLLLALSIFLMFGLGIAMEGKLYDLTLDQPLFIFAFIADMGTGLPYLLAQRWSVGAGNMNAPSYDYATTYLWVAGLLNYLVVLDAFDISQGRKK